MQILERLRQPLYLCHTDISAYGVVYVLKTEKLLFLFIKFFLSDYSCVKEVLEF